MKCQTHFGSKLAASLSAATYSSSRFSCAIFWAAFVTKVCKQSQNSFESVWKKLSPYSTALSSSSIYIFHQYMAQTSVSTTVVYCLQSKLLTHQSANITVHCTQNEKTVTIQLCQYQYPSKLSGWCIMNWNGGGRKWSQPVWSSTATFAWRDREKPMKICQASWCHGQYSHQVLPSEPIPSVDL